MEIGNEISHKIRSAIKAKLVELGSYVDDELPDYIMVMVANKKSQFQMSEDLGLFLGNNTEKFTTWLHSLLQKLQSITSDTAAAVPGKPSEKAVSVEKPKLKDQATSDYDANKARKTSTDESNTKKLDLSHLPESQKESRKRKSDSDLEIVDKPPGSIDVSVKSVVTDSDADFLVTASTHREPAYQSVSPAKEQSVKPATTDVIVAQTADAQKQAVSLSASTGAFDGGIQVVEDDDLSDLLLTENDELTEELEQETPIVVVTSNKKSDAQKVIRVLTLSDDDVSTERQRGTSSVVMSRISTKDLSPPRTSRPRALASPIRQTVRRVPVRMVEPRPSELQTRKRRGPVSVIGSVTHDSEEDDGGYDPHNPAVGNVASVVRVTARKSSVPPKMQANKSLLLKAMTEAEKSVETRRRVAITPIKPFMRSEGRERSRERDRDRDRRDRSRDQNRHGRSVSSSGPRESGHPSMRLAQASLRQAIAQPGASRHSDPPVYIPTKKVQPAPRAGSGDRRGIVSKSKRQEVEDRAWLDKEEVTVSPRKLIKREKGAPLVNFVIEAELDTETATQNPSSLLPPIKIKQEPRSENASPERNSPAPEPPVARKQKKSADGNVIDSRFVEYELEMVPSPTEEVRSESGSQGVPILLEDMDQDELLLDQDVIELDASPPPSPAAKEEDLRQSMVKEKAKDKTRFVVTLDGVDSVHYEMEVTEGGRYEEKMVMSGVQPSVLSQTPAAAAPQLKDPPIIKSPPKIQPMNINLKDSDEEGEEMEAEEATPLTQAKIAERCKFWPACVNGAACEYHHPTVQCKTFPMCKFGEKCLYIHPNCRFDSKCARPDCPYTHSSRRSVPTYQPAYQPEYRPPPPPPVITPSPRSLNPPQCKFFPACSNLSCPFFHPKPCRFGLTCKNREKGCPFYHPSLPSRKQLTWAAGKTTAVPTPVSVVAATVSYAK
ncbi:zinc finger CCCH domain-containing protein 14-like [Littorina saxatilis]|uniref:Zinc finger CCCH domain-containing protein 14 n=1 Tax=Littorina saxatilis TaxID=31220 RepID=A0AAN9B435_9CAEN